MSHGDRGGGGGLGPIAAGAPAPAGSAVTEMPVDDIAPPEAGPLRAGSVDDNADFAGYLEYLERIHSIGITLRDFDPTGRIVVTVTGTSGLPVAGAEVVVSAGGAEVARLRTTADGTARFHPSAYGAPDATSFDFTVGAQTVSAEPGGVATFSADAAGGATAPVAGRRAVPPRRDRLDGRRDRPAEDEHRLGRGAAVVTRLGARHPLRHDAVPRRRRHVRDIDLRLHERRRGVPVGTVERRRRRRRRLSRSARRGTRREPGGSGVA